MNTKDELRADIKVLRGKLLEVAHAMAKIQAKTSHQGFADAKRVIALVDEEELLDGTLRHEKQRLANDRD